MRKFNAGDTVRVMSGCGSHGSVGTVVRYTNHSSYKYVQVRLACGDVKSYNEDSLDLVKNRTTSIGDNEMLVGNYNIAIVKFVHGANTDSGYNFALFDDDIVVNDLVLCDTSNGYSVAKVIELIPKNEYNGKAVTKEIICKVDFTSFETRKENRKKANQIKSEMDKKIKNLQELALYEMMADKCPELKEMLDTYKQLI